MLTQHQFLNRLLGFYNIDGDRLPEIGEDDWPKFRDDPVTFFIRQASDDQQAAIWREIEARQTPDNRLTTLFDLMDAADDALDTDTYDQRRANDDFNTPDDAEWWIRAGTCRKIEKVFLEIDDIRKVTVKQI